MFFTKSIVNRIWYHLLGRGVVDPVDDFRDSNPSANDALLDALAKDFAANKFDVKYLIRTIMNSRTYQLSAQPNDANRDDESNFSRALIRPLQAEQLLDALAQVTNVPVRFPDQPRGIRAGQLHRTADPPASPGSRVERILAVAVVAQKADPAGKPPRRLGGCDGVDEQLL